MLRNDFAKAVRNLYQGKWITGSAKKRTGEIKVHTGVQALSCH